MNYLSTVSLKGNLVSKYENPIRNILTIRTGIKIVNIPMRYDVTVFV